MKYLKLELEGGEFVFRASKYSIDKDMMDEWCLVDIKAKIDTVDNHMDTTRSRVSSCVEIRIENDESLTCCELYRLEKAIDEALTGKLTEEKVLSPIEPYMQFIVSSVTPTDKLPIPCLQWRMFVWHDDSPTEQYFSICFAGNDLERISLYMKYLRGIVDESDKRLKDYLTENM